MIRSRFAPSPTGDLHLGGAWTALAAWAFARHAGGATVLRVEDIDTPRVVRGAAARIAEDLAWMGLDWDEGPIVQSARTAVYEAALAKLDTYSCDCSRAEIARVASAPHAGEELVYPGTCRDLDPNREMKRAPAIRLRVASGTTIAFDDLCKGRIEQDVSATAGDFVLRRGDGVFAYQLAVAIDDADERLTHVIRADDLVASTPRQILLMQLLGYSEIPRYAHLPLVVAPDGSRVAKRVQSASIRSLRDRGVSAEELIGELASALGLIAPTARATAHDVAASLREPSTWRREPWPMPSRWA
jgi:glutamyl-tRNA synthetase